MHWHCWGIAVTEWESRVVVECNEIDGFHLAVVNYAHNEEFISQNDLLLLSKVKVIRLYLTVTRFFVLMFWSVRISTLCNNHLPRCLLKLFQWYLRFCIFGAISFLNDVTCAEFFYQCLCYVLF